MAYINGAQTVICQQRAIPIRYPLFQDDFEDNPLQVNEQCWLVIDDYCNDLYLMMGTVLSVDAKNRTYDIRRMNDNQVVTSPWHLVVTTYHADLHRIDLDEHRLKMERLKNAPPQAQVSKKVGKKKNKKKGNVRKRKLSDAQTVADTSNKRRKHNDDTTQTIIHENAIANNHDDDASSQSHADAPSSACLAQPWFPVPHPYFRQNALLKWKEKKAVVDNDDNGNENDDGNEQCMWEVGRVLDFDIAADVLLIQPTFSCGTKDDEQCQVLRKQWYSFAAEHEAQFIPHSELFCMKQPVLYWWDRPGCGSLYEDQIEMLDYAADNGLIYAISGGSKNRRSGSGTQLKWCHKSGLFSPVGADKHPIAKYLARQHKAHAFRKSLTKQDRENKLYDCLVVGAGMAGLTAKWALDQSGQAWKTKILEAQNYVGGRLKPWIFPAKQVQNMITPEVFSVPETKVELGAAFLSGNGRDNRFWNWLKQKEKHICADWGGYNGGWWHEQSFIDADSGRYVDARVVRKIKEICGDLLMLSSKLLMPLQDISVVDGLDYLKQQIPKQQLFSRVDVDDDDEGDDDDVTVCDDEEVAGDNDAKNRTTTTTATRSDADKAEQRRQVEKYFDAVYEKFKILTAEWVGPQGLWQQQQTVELSTLDLEALYRLFVVMSDDHDKNANKMEIYLRAIERLMQTYYGDEMNIRIDGDGGADAAAVHTQAPAGRRLRRKRKQDDDDEDYCGETTESEPDSIDGNVQRSSRNRKNKNNVQTLPSTLEIGGNKVVRYNVADYDGAAPFYYRFGHHVLVRDLVHGTADDNEQLLRVSELSPTAFKRFKYALKQLAEHDMLSCHLYMLKHDGRYGGDHEIKSLLKLFGGLLQSFETEAVKPVRDILNGSTELPQEDEVYEPLVRRAPPPRSRASGSNLPQKEESRVHPAPVVNLANTDDKDAVIQPPESAPCDEKLNDVAGDVPVEEDVNGNGLPHYHHHHNGHHHQHLSVDKPPTDGHNHASLPPMPVLMQIMTSAVDSPPAPSNAELQTEEKHDDADLHEAKPNDLNLQSLTVASNACDAVATLDDSAEPEPVTALPRSPSKSPPPPDHESPLPPPVSVPELTANGHHDDFGHETTEREQAATVEMKTEQPEQPQPQKRRLRSHGRRTQSQSQSQSVGVAPLKVEHTAAKPKSRRPSLSLQDQKEAYDEEVERIGRETDAQFEQSQFDANLAFDADAEDLGDGFVTRGYSQVLETFAVDDDAHESKQIETEQMVTSVHYAPFERVNGEQSEHLCEVRGIDLKTYKPFVCWARYVVVSVSLGMLKMSLRENTSGEHPGIVFKPPLSEKKRQAIEAMGMGNENKIYLRFTKCFWDRETPYFQSSRHEQYRFINLSYPGFNLPPNTNVLCTMVPPSLSDRYQNPMSPAGQLRLVHDVLHVLAQMFFVNEPAPKMMSTAAECTQTENHCQQQNGAMESANGDVNGNVTKEQTVTNLKAEMDEDGDQNMATNEDTSTVTVVEEKEELKTNLTPTNATQDNGQRMHKLQSQTVPEVAQLLVDYKVTEWGRNPFTRGSYSYLPKGALYMHCKHLSDYDNNGVFFCGEATSIAGFECVDGAHETGFEAAKQIHKKLMLQRWQKENRISMKHMDKKL